MNKPIITRGKEELDARRTPRWVYLLAAAGLGLLLLLLLLHLSARGWMVH